MNCSGFARVCLLAGLASLAVASRVEAQILIGQTAGFSGPVASGDRKSVVAAELRR